MKPTSTNTLNDVSGLVSIADTNGAVVFGETGSDTCAANTLSGPVTVDGSIDAVEIGRSQVTGPIQVTSNGGGVDVTGNTSEGPVTVSHNSGSGAVTVSANTVRGTLACIGNSPLPGDAGNPNVVRGPATGQCTDLV